MKKTPLKRPAFPKALFLGGLGLTLALSLLFQWPALDRLATARFFRDGMDPWPGLRWAWSLALYRFGELPATLTGGLGFIAFLASFSSPRWRAWRGPGLYLALLLALGPGLLVNGLLKPLCGRPRPLEALGTGGLWPFQAAWHLGPAGQGTSFVSGHAANAWYFLCLAFLWPRRAWAWALALGFGLAMSLARVAQGAHWLSDTLIAGALLLALSAGLSPLIHWQPRAAFFKRPALWAALLLGLAAWLSLASVRYEDRRFFLYQDRIASRVPPQIRPLAVDFAAADAGLRVEASLATSNLWLRFVPRPGPQTQPMQARARFHGQGLPGAKESLALERLPGPGLGLGLTQSLRGLWLAKAGLVELDLANNVPVQARLHTDHGVITMGPLPPGRAARLSGLPEQSRPPLGFEPAGGGVWTLAGAAPAIELDLKADDVRFLAP